MIVTDVGERTRYIILASSQPGRELTGPIVWGKAYGEGDATVELAVIQQLGSCSGHCSHNTLNVLSVFKTLDRFKSVRFGRSRS